MLTVIAKIVAKKDKVSETKEALTKMIAPTLKEQGCHRYDLFQSLPEQNVFFFFEHWKDKQALEKHTTTKHYLELKQKSETLFQSPLEINLLNQIQ
jgi:quinol monooxygenase YgiN